MHVCIVCICANFIAPMRQYLHTYAFTIYYTQEINERREWTFKRDVDRRQKQHRMAVGNEKRKWQVKFYTKNGKPDRNRRPDQPSPITINRSGTRFLNGVSVVDLFAKFKGTSHSSTNKSNNTNSSNNNNMYDNNKAYTDGSVVESSLEINRRLRYGVDESSRFAYDMQVRFSPTTIYFMVYIILIYTIHYARISPLT